MDAEPPAADSRAPVCVCKGFYVFRIHLQKGNCSIKENERFQDTHCESGHNAHPGSQKMMLIFISTLSNKSTGVPGGLCLLSVWPLVSAQVMISRFVGSNPASGSAQTVQSLLGISLSPSLSAPPQLARSLSLSR